MSLYKTFACMGCCVLLFSCANPFKQLGREKKLMTCVTGRRALIDMDTIVLRDRYLVTENSCGNIPDHVDKTAWPSTLLFNANKSFVFTSDWVASPDYVSSKLTGRELFVNSGQVAIGMYDYNKFKKIITLKLQDTDTLQYNWEKTFKIKYSKKRNVLTLIKAKKQRKISKD